MEQLAHAGHPRKGPVRLAGPLDRLGLVNDEVTFAAYIITFRALVAAMQYATLR